MNETEEVFVGLFSRLREHLKQEPGIGLALKAEGPDVTLRVRSRRPSDDEKRPFFAIVIGIAERDGAFRITYNPIGNPPAERQITIVPMDFQDELLELVLRYVEEERRRLVEFRPGD
jgi:hypothetical protein